MRKTIAPLILIVLLLSAACPPARCEEWPAGWSFRMHVTPAEQAPDCELWLDHHGLALPDARDVRVFTAGTAPVSHFVSYADESRARIVFDGSAGVQPYSIYFGNLESDLPAVPANGIVAAGRPDWTPAGGFTSTVLKASQPIQALAPKMMTPQEVVAVYNKARAEAEAGQKAQDAEIEQENQLPADQKKPPRQRVPFIIRSIHPHANPAFPRDPGENVPGKDGKPVRVDNRFIYLMQCVIKLEQPADCYFVVGEGDGHTGTLKTLVADGNLDNAAVAGWYRQSYGYGVFVGTGTAKLAAGRHVLDLYTTCVNPNIRIRAGGADAPLELMDGRLAYFDNAAAVKPGELEVPAGTVAEAWLRTIEHWEKQGRFTVARTLSRAGTGRFRDQAASFADAAERVLQAANRKNWPTEGKYPSRTGFVPDARFGPPFRMAFANPSTSFHDRVGVGSLVWSESGLICGLPFQMFPAAWGLTSGTCVQDGILYAGLKTGQMLAVDAVKGSLVWSFPGEGPCYGTPLLYRDVLYYGSLDRRLYAIDVRRGRMLWNFPAHGWIEGSPAAEAGTVFVGARSGDFYAVDARLGVQRWQAKLDGRIIGTPACSAGRVFIGTQAGMFYALDAASGKTAWSFKASGSIDGGSCVGYDRVFFGDRSGQVYALNVADGKLAWPQPVGVSGPVAASPILVDRVIYGGTADGSTFWGIDIDDAVVGWSEPVPNEGAVCRPPLFAGDQLVFASRGWQRGLAGFVMAAPQQHACYTAKGAFQIDGDLSEPEWKQAPRLPVFLKHNGMQVGDPVDARLMWDGARLLFGITVTDANLQAAAANRDDDMARDDSITIAIDPNRGGLAVPVLRVSARGVQADSIVTGLGRDAADPKFQEDLADLKLDQTGPAWNPEWQAAVRLQGSLNNPGDQDTAWTAEIAIPFESLPPGLFNQKPGPGTTWQANVIVHSIGNGPAPAPEHRTWCVSTVLDPGSLGVPSRWMPFRLDAKTVDEFAKQPQKR